MYLILSYPILCVISYSYDSVYVYIVYSMFICLHHNYLSSNMVFPSSYREKDTEIETETERKRNVNTDEDTGGEVLEVVEELSSLLNTGLQREELSVLVNLIELGVNPQALAQGKS